MKIAGIVFLVGVIVLYGLSCSAKFSKRVNMLESMIAFIEYTENQIRFLGQSTDRILSDGMRMEKFNQLPFFEIEKNNKSVREEVLRNVERKYKCDFLHNTDFDHIKGFFKDLGTTDVDGEISICRMYKGLIQSDLNNAKSELYTKGKLYKSMSLLLAVALAIIFI